MALLGVQGHRSVDLDFVPNILKNVKKMLKFEAANEPGGIYIYIFAYTHIVEKARKSIIRVAVTAIQNLIHKLQREHVICAIENGSKTANIWTKKVQIALSHFRSKSLQFQRAKCLFLQEGATTLYCFCRKLRVSPGKPIFCNLLFWGVKNHDLVVFWGWSLLSHKHTQRETVPMHPAYQSRQWHTGMLQTEKKGTGPKVAPRFAQELACLLTASNPWALSQEHSQPQRHINEEDPPSSHP